MARNNLVGLRLERVDDLEKQYTDSRNAGYAFHGLDLFPPHASCPKAIEDINEMLPVASSDLIHSKGKKLHSGSIVGFVSAWIDCDSPDNREAALSEHCLNKELAWSTHLALPAVVVPLKHINSIKLARNLAAFTNMDAAPIKIWISLPMHVDGEEDANYESGDSSQPSNSITSPWHWWIQVVALVGPVVCDSLGLLLDFPVNLPDDAVIRRWLSEPVACLRIDTGVFILNSKGYPVLSAAHQRVLRLFLKINCQVIVVGPSRHERGYTVYQQYLNWLWRCTVEAMSLYEKHSGGLEDTLQDPLQPLQDNLSSATYGVFEMDPYKYQAYEEAIYLALCDRSNAVKSTASHDDEFPPLGCVSPPKSVASTSEKQVIYVLGAGQGPFVDASLRASKRSGCPVRVYVVEKNPNALLTLKRRVKSDWVGEDVHLVAGDMRNLTHPPLDKADIFVSELLGSFGDNELSPECLDGAQHMLKDDGISIPASYTSYVAPLQSLRVHLEASRQRDSTVGRSQSHLETPYVVRLQNCQLVAPPQEAFTFRHPRQGKSISDESTPEPTCTVVVAGMLMSFFVCLDVNSNPNSRYCCLSFRSVDDGVIHGFAGYFDSTLYGKVSMSTHPEHHSPNMFSWFPMVLPLRSAVTVRKGQLVQLHLWRCVSPRHVWYEWAITEPCTLRIHNSAGSAYKIGL